MFDVECLMLNEKLILINFYEIYKNVATQRSIYNLTFTIKHSPLKKDYPNTFFNKSETRAAGFLRIDNSSFAICTKSPSIALFVTKSTRSGFTF